LSKKINLTYRIVLIIILSLIIAGCPNDIMRSLVEEKVADPIANLFRVNSGAFATGNLDVQIQSDVFDALEMRFSNDRSTWSGWVAYSETYIWKLAPGADGDRTVFAEYRDEGHNTIRKQYTIRYDSTASDSPVLVGTPSPTNNTTPTWTWSPSSYDVVKYRFRFDDPDPDFSAGGGAAETTSTSFTPPLQADGIHTLYIVEIDIGDNISPVKSLAVTVDTLAPAGGAPAVTGVTPTNDSTPTWSWGAVAEATRYRWSYNNSSWTLIGNVTSFTPPAPLANGSYTLYVQAGDDAGNWTASGNLTIVVDIYSVGSPVVTSPAAITTDVTPTWNWGPVSGSNNYRWGFSEGSWTGNGNQTFYTPSSLTDGTHTLYVQAQNTVSSAWSSSGSYSVIVDTVNPVITYSGTVSNNGNPSFARVGNIITISFTAADSGSGLSGNPVVTIAGNAASVTGSGSNYTASYTMTALDTEGLIIYTISAIDAAGNTAPVSTGSTGITFDRTAPVVSGFMLNNGNTYSASPVVRASYTVTDDFTIPANLKMQLGGASTTPLIPVTPYYDIEATGLVQANFYDEAGNGTYVFDAISIKSGATDMMYETQTAPSFIGQFPYALGSTTSWLVGGDHAEGSLHEIESLPDPSYPANLWDEDWFLFNLDDGDSPQFIVSSDIVIDGLVKIEAFYDAEENFPVTVTSYTVGWDQKSITLNIEWDIDIDGEKNVWVKVSNDSVNYSGISYDLEWFVSRY
jgi:hypothetical protein